MRPNNPLLLSEMPEREAKLFILRAYKRSSSFIRMGKVCAVIVFVCCGVNILLDLWLWMSYSNFSVWNLLFYIVFIPVLTYFTVVLFMFPARFLSTPLSRYILPEGSIKEFYEKCAESIRSGIPLVNPDADDTGGIA